MRIAQAQDTKLNAAVTRLLAAERSLEDAKATHERHRQEVVELLQDENLKSTSVSLGDGVTHVFTRSSRTTTKIDEKGLRKALGAKIFDKYTDRKLNRSKLEKAVEHQEVDPLIVAKYLSQENSEEYITHRKEETDGSEA